MLCKVSSAPMTTKILKSVGMRDSAILRPRKASICLALVLFELSLYLTEDDPTVEIVGFTAAQIPGIDDRVYPASLAGGRSVCWPASKKITGGPGDRPLVSSRQPEMPA